MGIQGLQSWDLTLPIQCCLSLLHSPSGGGTRSSQASLDQPALHFPLSPHNGCVYCLLECLLSPFSPVKARFLWQAFYYYYYLTNKTDGFFSFSTLMYALELTVWITEATIIKRHYASGTYIARYAQSSLKLYIWWIRKWRLTQICVSHQVINALKEERAFYGSFSPYLYSK